MEPKQKEPNAIVDMRAASPHTRSAETIGRRLFQGSVGRTRNASATTEGSSTATASITNELKGLNDSLTGFFTPDSSRRARTSTGVTVERTPSTFPAAEAGSRTLKRSTSKVAVKSAKVETTVAIPYGVFLASKLSAASVNNSPNGSAATTQPSSACSASVDPPSLAQPPVPTRSASVVTAAPPIAEASRASSRSAATSNNCKASTTRLISVKIEPVESATEGTSSANGDRRNAIVELALLQAANRELRETTAMLKELLADKEVELARLKKERLVAAGPAGTARIQELEKQVSDQAQVISRLSVRLSANDQAKTLSNPA